MPPYARVSRLCLAALLLSLAAGCRDYQPPTDPDAASGPIIKTAVVGRVLDDNGRAVAGATVTLHGATTTSDADGIFTFLDASIPSGRALVQARAPGYFTASRGFIPGEGGSLLRLVLAERPLAGTLSATRGGVVQVGNGASVEIPAEGVVRADGTPYTGAVRVIARAWQPGDADFNDCFPGDARARAADGEMVLLVSLGFQNVELEDELGNELKLAPGARATLTYTLPEAVQGVAPERIPLWYFDEAKGLWIEEGEAVRRGNTYRGEVSHFTPWNCDWRARFGRICGTLKMCGEDPAAGITVNVGSAQTTTDAYGNFCLDVPAGWRQPFDIYATSRAGFMEMTSNHVVVPTVGGGETLAVKLEMTSIATVRGRMVDCNGQPTVGVVRAAWDGAIRVIAYTRDGRFTLGVPSGKEVTISTVSNSSVVPPQLECRSHDIGDIQMCSNGQTLPDGEQSVDWSITRNGAPPTVLKSGTLPGLEPGSVVLGADDSLTIIAQGPADNRTAQISIRAGVKATGVYRIGMLSTDPAFATFQGWDSLNTKWLYTGQDAQASPGVLTITKLDETRVEGLFNMSLENRTARLSYRLTGSFVGVRRR